MLMMQGGASALPQLTDKVESWVPAVVAAVLVLLTLLLPPLTLCVSWLYWRVQAVQAELALTQKQQSTQQGHAVAERAMEVAAGHTAAQATLQGTLLTPRSVSSVIGTLGDPGARAEMLLGVKLEMAGASKVVLDAKLALERMQLEYHHAILVEEATSAELQQLLERDMSAVELAKQLTQVSPALTRARTAVDAYHNRLWKAEAKLRHTLREHVDLSHNILNARADLPPSDGSATPQPPPQREWSPRTSSASQQSVSAYHPPPPPLVDVFAAAPLTMASPSRAQPSPPGFNGDKDADPNVTSRRGSYSDHPANVTPRRGSSSTWGTVDGGAPQPLVAPPSTGSSVMGFATSFSPPLAHDDPDALDAFLSQLRGVWHHQPKLSGEPPLMGGLEAAFMRSSPLEAHLLTPSAVVMVDARDSALVFKIRRPRKAPGSNTSSGRKVRAMRGSAERRLLYADGFKVSSNPSFARGEAADSGEARAGGGEPQQQQQHEGEKRVAVTTTTLGGTDCATLIIKTTQYVPAGQFEESIERHWRFVNDNTLSERVCLSLGDAAQLFTISNMFTRSDTT